VLPYAFDTNDMKCSDSFAFMRGNDFADWAIDAFEWLLRESRHSPRMMSIGLHTRILGRPGSIGVLAKLVDHVRERNRAWCATREQIACHFIAAVPAERA
jgi:allantoinase